MCTLNSAELNRLKRVSNYHNDRFMVQQQPGGNVAEFKPRPAQLLDQIRRLAADSRNVAFGPHARAQMEKRDLTSLDALRVLLTGHVHGDIEAGQNVGEWKCKVVAKRKGSRAVGVAVIVIRQGRLFVKTVEWEDR